MQEHEPFDQACLGDKRLSSAMELIVYQKAYMLAMQIYELSKRFPSEEKFALTSQTRQ